MSKLLFSAGLLLTAWVGLSSAGPAYHEAPSANTAVLSAYTLTEKFGPYDTYGEALTVALVLQAQGWATEIVQEADGYYVYAEL